MRLSYQFAVKLFRKEKWKIKNRPFCYFFLWYYFIYLWQEWMWCMKVRGPPPLLSIFLDLSRLQESQVEEGWRNTQSWGWMGIKGTRRLRINSDSRDPQMFSWNVKKLPEIRKLEKFPTKYPSMYVAKKIDFKNLSYTFREQLFLFLLIIFSYLQKSIADMIAIPYKGIAKIFQGGGHTVSKWGYTACLGCLKVG